jgi:3-oxoacyl-[acyl-carrier protein] reductase
MRLKDRIAVVTGGGRGLGRVLALRLAEEGASVVVADRVRSDMEATAEEIRAKGHRAAAVEADVSSYADANRIAEAAAELGGVDILVNNAAVYVRHLTVDFPPDEWERVVRVNLVGAFFVTRALLPAMIAAGRGAIINISSIHGLVGDEKLSAHCASKFGLIGFTQSLAKELRPYNITVNAVCPGALSQAKPGDAAATKKGLESLVPPHAVAQAVMFLATQNPPAITGASLSVYGGTDTKITVHTA